MTTNTVLPSSTHVLVPYSFAGWKHGQMSCVLWLESLPRLKFKCRLSCVLNLDVLGENGGLEFIQVIVRIQFPSVGGTGISAGCHPRASPSF